MAVSGIALEFHDDRVGGNGFVLCVDLEEGCLVGIWRSWVKQRDEEPQAINI